LLFVLWFFSDNFKEKINFLKFNKTILYLLAFIAFSLLSLLWSDNVSSGLYYIRKYWYFLPIFVIATTVSKKYINYAISAFLIGMFISEVISYGVFFEIWTFKRASVAFPTPFMNHIQYSVFLAFTALLLLNRLFYTFDLKYKIIYSLYFVSVTANLFMNAGRTGQVAFLVSIFVLLFLNFKNKFIALSATFVLVSSILFISYQISPNFQNRIQAGISDVHLITKKQNYNNSWGLRLGAWINASELISQNPILGTGVNNEMSAMRENIDKKHPKMLCVKKMPSYHNYYIQTTVRLGLIGLILYMMIYYSLIKLDIKNKEDYNLKIVFISVFMISALVENVFHEQFTQAIFALFVGIFLAQNRIEKELS